MVVGPDSMGTMETPAQIPSSPSPLKFGMDRILSCDSSSSQCGEYKSSYQVPENSHECSTATSQFTADCIPRVDGIRQCCSITNLALHRNFFNPPTTIYVPQPLRPYTNVVLQTEPHNENTNASTPQHKRKRSWSRAVFSNLQRKGLEKRFQLQKYITKPDRRQLAATLGLTDAQVKVWFQNRRMKWRHAKEVNRDEGAPTTKIKSGITLTISADSPQGRNSSHSDCDSDIDVHTVDFE